MQKACFSSHLAARVQARGPGLTKQKLSCESSIPKRGMYHAQLYLAVLLSLLLLGWFALS